MPSAVSVQPSESSAPGSEQSDYVLVSNESYANVNSSRVYNHFHAHQRPGNYQEQALASRNNTLSNAGLGPCITDSGCQLLAINVYLPYSSEENVESYFVSVGESSSIIDDHPGSVNMVLGDFIACVCDRYSREWSKLCEYYNLTFSDVDIVPESSFTHINCGTL